MRNPDPNLVSDIKGFLNKYVALPSQAHALVLAIWIIHTWLFRAFNVTPYLFVYSDDPGSGKTRLLETLGVLCQNSKRADDMTAPVMFKLIARYPGGLTLLKDEIDTVWSGSRNEPQRQIFNTGYRKGGTAWREQARELIEFPTFCAKVLAGLNNGFMPETVRDRCIPIQLEKRKDQKIERFVESRIRGTQEHEELLDRLMAFAELFYTDVEAMRPEPMWHLSDRQDEISEPLLCIAAVLGVEQELREALTKLFLAGQKKTPNSQQVIFKRIFDAFQGDVTIWTEDLCMMLSNGWDARTLALWLQPYGIGPMNIRKGTEVRKGYKATQFMAAWDKYLGIKEDNDEAEQESETEMEAA